MIKFKDVTKVFPPSTVALDTASFHVKPGEFVSIVGQSGSGKTTVIRLLTGEIRATRGRIEIGGWDITRIKKSALPILRRQIGVIFQDFKLLERKTVEENIAFALQVSGAGPKRIQEVTPQVLSIVGLQGKEDRYPVQLSGGEQQRVAIARALVHRPKVLLADEPTGNLDYKNTDDIIRLLLKINEFGTTVVLVSHDPKIVNSVKRRVITLSDGKIVSDQKVGRYNI
ncbi:MAG: cell division ATP-binding protein FtsE [Candidatus Buchananbacteria bacterium CG10_big_fil_rev_8_21_14_0_10_42_9]|uniref:Cell division ATP-binding protein FtsE n=1 Tax=Candidatus Buchananbacteria bacterium CG10_big_fil_rev_8_21_14_0_10_42_9 TaxID=1974526 RepID=A0A2H0W1J1_9BACT|nr:MAG: cell division ATP-binding protein FtsE [Candidatus Buchananbacteria bacterium CG10_big_fil_rev_8_21_14_0_10_42_9]